MIFLVSKIGQKTISAKLQSIMVGIFISQYLNTAVLVLLVQANFTDSGVPLGWLFNGQYSDFSAYWYSDIGGAIVQTMLINAFMPAIDWIFFALKLAMRFRDRGFGKDVMKTSKKTIYQYVDLYSGNEY